MSPFNLHCFLLTENVDAYSARSDEYLLSAPSLSLTALHSDITNDVCCFVHAEPGSKPEPFLGLCATDCDAQCLDINSNNFIVLRIPPGVLLKCEVGIVHHKQTWDLLIPAIGGFRHRCAHMG